MEHKVSMAISLFRAKHSKHKIEANLLPTRLPCNEISLNLRKEYKSWHLRCKRTDSPIKVVVNSEGSVVKNCIMFGNYLVTQKNLAYVSNIFFLLLKCIFCYKSLHDNQKLPIIVCETSWEDCDFFWQPLYILFWYRIVTIDNESNNYLWPMFEFLSNRISILIDQKTSMFHQ